MTANPTPFFLESGRGRIFAIHHCPPPDIGTRGHILCVPPFNEEMNRCRSMVTLQAQAFAECGFGTLVIDLHGTGESDGEHGDARWSTWLDDIHTGMAWLDAKQGCCVGLLGIRLGVPLAAQALQDASPRRRALIAWQPVLDGKSYFTQFLRMRIAANMDRTDIPKESTAEMRNSLQAGTPIEVAGYEIHPELATAIEQVRLADLKPLDSIPVAWFEKASSVDGQISPASRTLLADWEAPARLLAVNGFEGAAFWALHDRVTAPELITLTTEWLVASTDQAT